MPVQFGDFMLDESRRQLLRGGDPIHLSPKAFQFLSILIHETPRAVSKADLQERVWPETFVTEGNLATVVAELRSALDDDRRDAKFIRTLYGFGYSFTAPVANVASPSARRVRWRTAAVAAVLGAVGIVLILSLRSTESRPSGAAPIRSLAILPFDTTGSDRTEEHLGLGLPDVLITRLSNVRNLVVRPTSAIREFAGRPVDSRRIARDLKVDAVLEGSIRTSADRIRITVQLLNARQEKPIWADQFDEKRADIFAIEDNISRRVADALMLRLTPNEKSLLAKRYTGDSEAYQLYVQGRYHLQRAIEGEGKERKTALEFFQKAVEKDPGYALAWAGLAHTYAGLGAFNQGSREVLWPKAEEAALKALQIDSDLSEAHSAVGAVRMYWNLDFTGAQREFLRALELNPRNILALRYYAFLLQCIGRFEEAITLHERQIEIDPTSPAVHQGLANAYFHARKYDRAIEGSLMVLQMNPNNAQVHIALARAYSLRGESEKAIAQARQAGKSPNALAFLSYALARSGKRDEANQIRRALETRFAREQFSPFVMVIADVGLGDREAAFPLLEKAVKERSYIFGLKTDAILDPMRSDPRFAALLELAGYGS
jgi:TolB-like protein/DNA-binding winged helix-turn-helix (wHTH) protein/Tfp pilus assembly protein PilF